MIVRMLQTVPLATDGVGYERVTLAEGGRYEVTQDQGDSLVRSGLAEVVHGEVTPPPAPEVVAFPGAPLAEPVSDERLAELASPAKPTPTPERTKPATPKRRKAATPKAKPAK
jgi:hypothetical protein